MGNKQSAKEREPVGLCSIAQKKKEERTARRAGNKTSKAGPSGEKDAAAAVSAYNYLDPNAPDLLATAGGISPVVSKKNAKKLSRDRKDDAVMSDYEQHLLVTTWNGILDKRGVIKKIFIRLFDTKPELKLLFPWRAVPASKLEDDPQLDAHAGVILHELENAIDNMECMQTSEVFHEHLTNIGASHARHKDGQEGLLLSHWGIFMSCALISITELYNNHKEKDAIVEAWRQFLSFIIQKVRQGFTQKCRKLEN